MHYSKIVLVFVHYVTNIHGEKYAPDDDDDDDDDDAAVAPKCITDNLRSTGGIERNKRLVLFNDAYS